MSEKHERIQFLDRKHVVSETGGVVITFGQLDPKLITREGRIADPAKQWEKITRTLEHAVSSSDSSADMPLVILPELATPLSKVRDLQEFLKDKMPAKAVVVAGIELFACRDLPNLARELNAKCPNAGPPENSEEWYDEYGAQYCNACAVFIKNTDGLFTYLQLKLDPSWLESSPYPQIVSGRYVYRFNIGVLRFSVLICSDMYTADSRTQLRYVELVDHKFIREKDGLDLLINIQCNPKPLHENFTDGLRGLYSYAGGVECRNNATRLATLAVNWSFGDQPFSSYFVVYRNMKLHAEKRVCPIDAPVHGYAVPSEEAIRVIRLKRRPSEWDRSTPGHITIDKKLTTTAMQEEVEDDGDDVRYITQYEKFPILDKDTCETIAVRLIQVGQYDTALGYLDNAVEYYKQKNQWERVADIHYEMAKAHRHKGEFDKNLEHLSESRAALQKAKNKMNSGTYEFKLLRHMFAETFGNSMLREGELGVAHDQYRTICTKARKLWGQSKSGRDALYVRCLHLLRADAEVMRLKGEYTKSARLCDRLFRYYDYQHAEEKAYSLLIRGDALRMCNNYADAEHCYKMVLRYCNAHTEGRLKARAEKGMFWLALMNGEDMASHAKLLEQQLHNEAYRFGVIHAQLCLATLHLVKHEYEEAKSHYKKALHISTFIRTHGKDVEDVIAIESSHAKFGIAESLRLGGEVKSVEKQYAELHHNYNECGLQWGIEQTQKAIRAVKEAEENEGRGDASSAIVGPLVLNIP